MSETALDLTQFHRYPMTLTHRTLDEENEPLQESIPEPQDIKPGTRTWQSRSDCKCPIEMSHLLSRVDSILKELIYLRSCSLGSERIIEKIVKKKIKNPRTMKNRCHYMRSENGTGCRGYIYCAGATYCYAHHLMKERKEDKRINASNGFYSSESETMKSSNSPSCSGAMISSHPSPSLPASSST